MSETPMEKIKAGLAKGRSYYDHLEKIAITDAQKLIERDKEYGSSWKKRGGIGAFMMLARKWDRIETQVDRTALSEATEMPGDKDVLIKNLSVQKVWSVGADRFDILAHVAADPRETGLIDDIRDLRGYLLLLEAELIERGIVKHRS